MTYVICQALFDLMPYYFRASLLVRGWTVKIPTFGGSESDPLDEWHPCCLGEQMTSEVSIRAFLSMTLGWTSSQTLQGDQAKHNAVGFHRANPMTVICVCRFPGIEGITEPILWCSRLAHWEFCCNLQICLKPDSLSSGNSILGWLALLDLYPVASFCACVIQADQVGTGGHQIAEKDNDLQAGVVRKAALEVAQCY